MEKRLKDKQYYIDLYDRHTVDLCRRYEKPLDDELPEDEKVTKEEANAIKKWVKEMIVHFQSGERYLRKESTIREWMDRDQKLDDLYESAQPPEGIRCLTCRNKVEATFKTLWHGTDDKADRMLSMFDCPNKCLPRRAFFSDGEEYRPKPNLCPNCNTPLEHTEKDDGVEAVSTYTCSKCAYSKTEEYVWSKKEEEEIDEKFAADRDRFCMTDEEGKKFQDEKWNLEQIGKFMEEWKEEEKRRDEKLKANPKGFHLEGRGYTCSICGDSTPEGDNWYDEYGIKCLICQKAIDNGEVPATLGKDKDSWYEKYDIERAFNVKGPTLQKWVRKGLLKPRTISHYGNGVHYEFFIIEDNADFLPPKKLVESQYVNVKDENGKVERRNVPWCQLYNPHEHLKGYKIMEHLRVVPPEEVKAKEEEKQRKWEEKRARREMRQKSK